MASLIDSFTYDVFISFRGEDTRYGFTGNLWKALHDKGIHTFIDDEELQKGDEITPSLLKAIEQSRMAIIVLSKNYASSSFCLQELSKILDSVKNNGSTVWPVFYNVDPSDVRKLKRTYGEAMNMHEVRSNHNLDLMQKWKKALHQVANFSGFHYKNGDGYEHEFIGKIVERVSREIKPVALPVADYLVGLEPQKQNVSLLLNVGSDDKVHMVGICGIGGIGKTTLALAVYNSIAHQFQASCFLEKVRENSEKHGLQYLQHNLLSQIVGEKNVEVTSVKEGMLIIQQRLRQKKILVLLDDVDKEDQLHAIAGKPDWFGLGSRVIITTRDKRLLTCHGVESTYDVEELNKEDAFELFRRKAFKTAEISSSYANVVNRAVTYASGLPLALEVIGSHLFNKTAEQCKSALDRYARIPDKNIQTILRVSFDALEEELKSVFLDIACCFKGYKLANVEKMLHAHHGHNKIDHISVLVEKSLIKITKLGNVTLHDLIEDMGKEIVRQESPGEPGKRSRLWFPEDIVHVLEENTGTSEIKITCPDSRIIVEWDGKAFKKMKNLRTLIIMDGQFSENPKHLPNSLRILQHRLYPSWGLPSDFYPKKLSVCNIPTYSTSFEWDNFFKKRFENMRALSFDYYNNLTWIPDISGLQNLEEFSFRNCISLHTVDDSVGLLGKLKILKVDDCMNLKCIPPLKLPFLEELHLSSYVSLQSFPPIVDGFLGKLKILRVISCYNLKSIPPFKFPLLEELDLSYCDSLESFPLMMDGLPGKLKILRVINCTNLNNIPPLKLPLLEEFYLSHCDKLESFPLVGLLCKLKILKVISCSNLSRIPLLKFPSLEELEFSYCDRIKSFPSVVDGLLDKLKILIIKSCNNIRSFPSLKFPSLEELHISCCNSLKSFPPMADEFLGKLKFFRISDCTKLKTIAPIKFPLLEELHFSGCDSLDSFPPTVDGLFSELKILRVINCRNLTSISPLNLPLLEVFDLSFCDRLENFPPIVDGLLGKLKILIVSSCPSIRSIQLVNLPFLEELRLSWCTSLESFPPVEDGLLRKLKILIIHGCTKLRSIPPLKFPSLEEFDLSCCNSLESFPPVVNGLLGNLKTLRVTSCKNLEYSTSQVAFPRRT